MAGLSVAPMPQQACIQFRCRGWKRAAAKTFIAASTAPAPRPDSSASATSAHQGGARAAPSAASAVSPTLAASTPPVPKAAMARPERMLAAMVPAETASSSAPSAATGCP